MCKMIVVLAAGLLLLAALPAGVQAHGADDGLVVLYLQRKEI
jgi:hypothetical protein